MWYEFTKTIYDVLDEKDIFAIIDPKNREMEEKSRMLIETLNKARGKDSVFYLMGIKKNSKLFIKDFKEILRSNLALLHKNKDKSIDEIKELLNKNNLDDDNGTLKNILFKHCIFTYFYIIENFKINTSKKDFYKGLLESAGISYSPTVFANMEEAIIYYILDSEQHSDIFVSLIKDWNEEKDNYGHDLKTPVIGVDKLKELTLESLNDLISHGYENEDEAARITRKSVEIIDGSMKEISKKTKGKTKINEIFEEKIITLILDAASRRQWYLLNMIRLIIEKQVEMLVTAYEESDGKEFDHLKSIMWLGTPIATPEVKIKETWKDISVRSSYDVSDIECALRQSRIIPGKISDWLGRMVDEDSRVEGEYENDEITWISPLAFEGVEYIEDRYEEELSEEDEMWSDLRKGESRMRSILSVEKENISRELLLLLTLACKVYGEESMSMNYVKANILYNSRLHDSFIPETNEFDKYYLDVFGNLEGDLDYESFVSRMKYMQERSSELEKLYYFRDYDKELEEEEREKLSIFTEIICGNKLEW